jgi:NAD(P)H-dependent FMN reductase
MKILAVCGSTHRESNSLKILDLMSTSARQAGAEVDVLDLLATPLPLFRTDQTYAHDQIVADVRQLCQQTDAFLLVSPEYHGCMSGWMKNFFDFHYHEFAGKLFALAASTGGSLGVSCLTQMRVAVQHCHGWSLPYQAAAREADFSPEGELINAAVVERLQRMGRDTVVYGRLLRQQFQHDRAWATDNVEQALQAGFAGWYTRSAH